MADLLRLPGFVRLMAVAALVLGSHAVHDGFEVLRWTEAGIGPCTAGLPWSEAVLAEVLVFALAGPPLLAAVLTLASGALYGAFGPGAF